MNIAQQKQIFFLSLFFLLLFSLFTFLQKQTERELKITYDENNVATISYDNYFKDKTIEWIIPFKEGGGGDTWARFNLPFLSNYIPGNPIIVINNIPGGGSIKGGNIFSERVQSDGLIILGTSGTTQMPYLLDDPRVLYDYRKYKPLMVYPSGGVVYCSPKLGISSAFELEKIKNIPLQYASQGPTSLDIVPMFSFDLLGLDVEAVFGFRGRGAGRLAFERGEVMIDYQTSSAYIKNVKPMVENGEAIPLFSFGILDAEGNLVRDPSFPDLPHFGEIYEQFGFQREGIQWTTWSAFMAAGFGGMKLLLTSKDTPDQIVAEFQKGIIAMKKDTLYLKTKGKALGLYEQSIGKNAERIFKQATEVNEEEKEYMKNWLRKKYDLNI